MGGSMRVWNVSPLRRENLIFIAGREPRRALEKRDLQSFLLYYLCKGNVKYFSQL